MDLQQMLYTMWEAGPYKVVISILFLRRNPALISW